MADLYVNVSGTWKTASNYYVNVNGTWKEGSELQAKVSSAWKQSSSSSSSGANIVDVFNTFLYTGNGLATSSNRAIGVGIDLATDGGLVWIKNRSQAEDHVLQDTTRGAGTTKRLASNSSDATNSGVNASGGGHISSFTSTGFELNNGSATTNLEVNNNNDNYVAWTFKKTPGFFDIQTWTGNATNNRTISHSIGSVPGAIWIKCTSDSGGWTCYHRQTNATDAEDWYLQLDGTNDKTDDNTIFNDTAPTSSVFTLGTNDRVNGNSKTYIAYIFAHNDAWFGSNGNEAIIYCGSYTGASAPLSVTIGWQPQWILFKNPNNLSMNWRLYDTARTIPPAEDPRLMPNLTNAEDSNFDKIDVTSTGFTIDRNNNDMNEHGALHAYIAIRNSFIITTNLVLYLDAGNNTSYSGSGTTWNDISGNGNNFTLTNSPTYTSSDGGAIVFDGTDDYASKSFASNSAFDFGTNSFTIGMWVYLDSFDINDAFFATHDNTYGSNFSNNSFEVRRKGSNNAGSFPEYEHRLDQTPTRFTVGSTAQQGTFDSANWYYYVCTFENSSSSPYGTVKLYLNSTLISSGSSANASGGQHNFTTNNIVYLAKNRATRYMDGRMAQVHVYKGKALTASEVLQNYNATKSNYV